MNMEENLAQLPQGKLLHRFAVLVACCTWLLIIAGALVTSNEAGLSVPDWPLSYGSLMPPMIGGIFYEHGHRMIAASVGLLTVILSVWLWRKEPRRWVRHLGLWALAAVVCQGLLGGITVLLFLPAAISVVHGSLAQAFFCMVVTIAWVTSLRWGEPISPLAEDTRSVPLRRLAWFTTASVYVQLILGAILRHSKSGILFHVFWALIVTFLVTWVFIRVTGMYVHVAGLFRPAILLYLLLGIQLFLGVLSYWIRAISRSAVQPLPSAVVITTTHVAVGALVLAVCLILALQSYRLLLVPEKRSADEVTPQRQLHRI
jgi:cytochrome c oxidase assembly protein subunit 15